MNTVPDEPTIPPAHHAIPFRRTALRETFPALDLDLFPTGMRVVHAGEGGGGWQVTLTLTLSLTLVRTSWVLFTPTQETGLELDDSAVPAAVGSASGLGMTTVDFLRARRFPCDSSGARQLDHAYHAHHAANHWRRIASLRDIPRPVHDHCW